MPISPMHTSDYVFLPITVALLIALLALVLRWSNGARGSLRRPPAPGSVGDHGLLVPMTTVRDPQRAAVMVAALREVDIAASLSGPPGRQLLLVWPDQVDTAWHRLVELAREER
ncbi:MAG: hypothetical protein ACR2KL_11615 [Nocardioidaceae bacterium]